MRTYYKNPAFLAEATRRYAWQTEDDLRDVLDDVIEPPADEDAALKIVGGFGSAHTGGCQVCIADGSVRFLSENIDPFVWSLLGDRADGEMPTGW